MRLRYLWAAIAVSLSGTVGASDNVVRNGDFENGLEHWSPATWISNNGTPILEKIDMPGPGTGSLKIVGAKDRKLILWQPITLPEGSDKFVLSVQMHTVNVETGYCICYVSLDGVKQSPAGVNTIPAWQNGVNTAWKVYRQEFTVPKTGARTGKMYITTTEGALGTFYVDDVSITPAVPVKTTDGGGSAVKSAAVAVPSGQNLLTDNYETLSWYGPANAPQTGRESLSFNLTPGKVAAVMQRVRVSEMDGEIFRLTAWVKAPKNFRTIWQLGALHRNPDKFKSKLESAQATGKIDRDGFAEYRCDIQGFDQDTLEIRTIFHSGKAAAEAVQLEVRNVRLEALLHPTREIQVDKVLLAGADHDSLFAYDTVPSGAVVLKSTFPEPHPVKLEFIVTDFHGREIARPIREITLPGMKFETVNLTFPELAKRPGFYVVTLKGQPELNLKEQKFSMLVTAPVPEPRDPVFGFNFFTNTAAKSPGMRLLGVGSKGHSFEWRPMSDGNGNIQWENEDKAVAAARAAKIKLIGGLRMEGSLAAEPFRTRIEDSLKKNPRMNPYDTAYHEAHDKFVRAVVERYKNDIQEWSLIGEINLLQSQRPFEIEHYLERVRRTAKIIRSLQPDAVIIGIGCSGSDGRAIPRYPVMRELWENQQLCEVLDGVGLDQYSSPQSYGPGYKPVDSEQGMMREMLTEALRIVKARGKNVVAVDEKGFNITSSLPIDSIHAMAMANVLAREYVIFKSLPEVRHWLYYKWTSFTHNELQDWGMFAINGPRPSAAAYAGVARMLAHAQFVVKPELHRAIQAYLFKAADGRTLTVLWHSGENSATMLADLPGQLEFFDLQGNPQPHTTGREYKLTAAPVYIFSTADSASVQQALSRADIRLPELTAEFNMARSGEVELLIRNLTAKPLSGTAECFGGKYDFKLAANALGVRRIPHETTSSMLLQGRIVTPEGRQYQVENVIRVFSVPAVGSPVELKQQKPIAVLDNAELHLSNIDFQANKLWTGPADCSAEVRMGYDAENFYLNLAIRDDFHVNTGDVRGLWRGDSVQFAFDPNCDAKFKALNNQDGIHGDDLLFSAGIGRDGAGLFCDIAEDPALDRTPLKGITARRQNGMGRTEMEITIPWRLLKIKPDKGVVFGFNLIVLDADDESQGVLYWMQWTPGIAGGQNPGVFQRFMLN